MEIAVELRDAELRVVMRHELAGQRPHRSVLAPANSRLGIYCTLVRNPIARISRPLATRRLATALIICILLAALPAKVQGQDPYSAARNAAQHGQLDSAYRLIVRAAAAEPDSAAVQFWLGEIAAFKARSSGFSIAGFAAARHSKAGFARAVKLQPDNPDYLQGFAEFLAQAPGIAGGDRNAALALARHLRQVDAVRGTIVTADILHRGNGTERARADSLIAALILEYPADRIAQGGAGNYYAVTGRPALGVPLYQGLVERDSTDGDARYGLARLLVMTGHQPRRAQVQLRYVLDHSSALVAQAGTPGAPGRRFWFSPAAAWLLLGRTYRELGMSDSARVCYRRALALDPESRPAQAALDSLR